MELLPTVQKITLSILHINAMGLDITDINNDGLADVVELDMKPGRQLPEKDDAECEQL